MMRSTLQDIRYAFRGLKRQPGFAVVMILTLAIGIGANTAMFSVVNAVLLRDLPYARPEELVVVLGRSERAGNAALPVAPADFADLRESRSFVSIAAAEVWGATVGGTDRPEAISGLRVTASLFSVLEAAPAIGRLFTPDDERPQNNHIVLLGQGLWKRRFGADPAILGRKILLNGASYQVVGVMPEAFRFPLFWATRAEMWTPLALTPEQRASRGAKSLRLFARLRPGVTLAQAQSEMDAMTPRLVQAAPEQNTGLGISVTPLHEMVVGKVRFALFLLLGAVGLVLMIACANVANLLLARSITRRKEVAVRVSAGATGVRLARQMITESIVLGLCGGSLGLTFAFFSLDALSNWFRTSLPRFEEIRIDPPVLLFTVAVSLTAAILFGLAPALQLSHSSLTDSLKASSRGVQGSRWTSQLRNSLVAAQMAFALVLLAGAGLLGRSLLAVQAIHPGFEPDHVLTASLNAAGTSVSEPAKQVQFYRAVLERVSSLPGVISAAMINHLPLAGDAWGTAVLTPENPSPTPGDTPRGVFKVVSPAYFATMRVPLKRGRDFTEADFGVAQPVVVITETMATLLWPGQDPIGKRLRLGPEESWHTVIGVSAPVKQQQWMADPVPELYISYLQHPGHFKPFASSMSLVVRTSGDPGMLSHGIEEAVHSVNQGVPVSEISTLTHIVSDSTVQPRMYATLLGLFAAGAVLLSCIGIYGVISYTVRQRTHEMGVRMAVGATKLVVLRLVMGDALVLSLAGAAAGLAASLVLSRYLGSLLYGVKPHDAGTFCIVSLILLGAAMAAAYIPARRVAVLDPLRALRND